MVLGKADHVQFGGSTEDIVPIDCVVGERTDRMQSNAIHRVARCHKYGSQDVRALPWFPGVTSPAFMVILQKKA